MAENKSKKLFQFFENPSKDKDGYIREEFKVNVSIKLPSHNFNYFFLII